MIATRFVSLGSSPTFFNRLRTWFRQTFVVDFAVAEILGPVPVIAKEQEAKIINTPAPFTRSANRAPALLEARSTSPAPWMEMGPFGGIRRQIRRRKGWYDLRKSHQHQAAEESKGLLMAAELS